MAEVAKLSPGVSDKLNVALKAWRRIRRARFFQRSDSSERAVRQSRSRDVALASASESWVGSFLGSEVRARALIVIAHAFHSSL
jgi:hypothetical protein